jgi:hypothetical protein
VSARLRWIGSAAAAAAILVCAYMALGGLSYVPAAAPNPCTPRPWPRSLSTQGTLEQIGLDAIGRMACRLQVPREELVLAFAQPNGLHRFAVGHGLSDRRLQDAARVGLLEAIDRADRTGRINGLEAFLLRAAAQNVPVARLVELARGALGG